MSDLEYSPSSEKGRPAVVAPPHPLYGGRMDNPVVTCVAAALAECGYAPLLFNWRGVGKSAGGAPSGKIEDGEADYRAALAKARDATGLPGARVLAAGFSFGALAALRVCENDDGKGIERLLLIAPPLRMVGALDLASIEQPIHVVVGASDQYCTVDQLADALAKAPSARLDVIPDADHFFGFPPWLDKLAELVRLELG